MRDGEAALAPLRGRGGEAAGLTDQGSETLQRSFAQVLCQLDRIGVGDIAGRDVLQADIAARGDGIGVFVVDDLVREKRALIVRNFDMALGRHQARCGVVGDLVRLKQHAARLAGLSFGRMKSDSDAQRCSGGHHRRRARFPQESPPLPPMAPHPSSS